jgi:hypothetical protein
MEVGRYARQVARTGRRRTGDVIGLPAPAYLVGGLALVFAFSFAHEVLHDRVAWTLLALLAGCHRHAVSRRLHPTRGV